MVNEIFNMDKLIKTSLNKSKTDELLYTKPSSFVLPDFPIPAGYKLVEIIPKRIECGQVKHIFLIY